MTLLDEPVLLESVPTMSLVIELGDLAILVDDAPEAPARIAVPALGSYARFVKPAIDRTVAAVLLLVLAPVLLVIAVAVGCSMGWPVLFRQERVGLGGRTFSVCKFRTMLPESVIDLRTTADRLRDHKRADDPRITRVGAWLRRTSLDELPQLWNVLRGEMSLIGPRPELPWIVELHGAATARHAVRPGMTGLWQVSERGSSAMHECVDIDLHYVEQLSARTDLSILLRTPLAAIKGH